MTLKALLVDDDPDIRTIGELSLATVGGFEVVVAESGLACLDRAQSARPDVILLDVMMPELDGPSTLRRLRADPRTADIPVIFLTAKVQERGSYLKLGAAGVINKPFDPMTLPDRVRALLQG